MSDEALVSTRELIAKLCEFGARIHSADLEILVDMLEQLLLAWPGRAIYDWREFVRQSESDGKGPPWPKGWGGFVVSRLRCCENLTSAHIALE